MEIEFDPTKDAANRAKHGLGLSLSLDVFESAVGSMIDQRHRAEIRILTYGFIDGVLHACVHTQRGGVSRVISLRRASRKERLIWPNNLSG